MAKHTLNTPKAPTKGRIRPALSTAIRLIVEEGFTQVAAAQAVGMKQISLSMALKKPHVVALRSAVKRAWLDSQTDKAWVLMADLAQNAVSEDVRLKAAKVFLEAAGELDGSRDSDRDRGPRSLVQIVVNHSAPPQGMSATPRLPGVIEITHAPGRSGRYEVAGEA